MLHVSAWLADPVIEPASYVAFLLKLPLSRVLGSLDPVNTEPGPTTASAYNPFLGDQHEVYILFLSFSC